MKVENTNNKNVKKFVLDKPYFQKTKEYTEVSQTSNFPLAGTLLQFPFVLSVLTSGDFIAIHKIDEVAWEDVEEEVGELIEKTLSETETTHKQLPIEVYMETTPNPNVIKLVTNALLIEGIAEAENEDEATDFPLAQFLLELPYVDSVFVQDNYISLTKTEKEDWQEYALEIRDIVSQYLRKGKPVVNENYQFKTPKEFVKIEKEYTDIEKEIQKLIEEYIQPAVASDGGNIDLVEFDEDTKTAKMLLQGACSGCPSSTITLKNGIETLLKQMLPNQVEKVEAING